MAILRRLSFYLGLMMGLTTIAAAGAVALTYVFTGRFPSVELGGEQPEVTLLTPDEVVSVVREQVEKAKAAQEAESEGEESDE
jgi:uncharacterized iron-regulated membrane protein